MPAPIAIVGAPTSIGIKPYDDGRARRLDLAPHVLRALGIVERFGAEDLGDVVPPAYRDFVKPPNNAVRNEREVESFSRELAGRIASALRSKRFPLVLGGDCSVVLASLLGARMAGRSRVGLLYVDAHGDFASPQESRSGSAASMCLSLAVGRGDSTLARLDGGRPLVAPEDVAIILRRDDDEPYYGQDAIRALPILDITDESVRDAGIESTAAAALERVAPPELDGFWIHVDADAIDPREVPAVDSPTPGGLGIADMAALLLPFVRHPKALGLELTIYDPELDPERTSAARLVDLLQRTLGSGRAAA
jgi:arginase